MDDARRRRLWRGIVRRTTRRGMPLWQRILHALGWHPHFFIKRGGTAQCADCGRVFH